MQPPFVGQVVLYAFKFAPSGWAPCEGQLLPVNQNPALFSLLGTTFGGNGQTTFGLPDRPAQRHGPGWHAVLHPREHADSGVGGGDGGNRGGRLEPAGRTQLAHGGSRLLMSVCSA